MEALAQLAAAGPPAAAAPAGAGPAVAIAQPSPLGAPRALPPAPPVALAPPCALPPPAAADVRPLLLDTPAQLAIHAPGASAGHWPPQRAAPGMVTLAPAPRRRTLVLALGDDGAAAGAREAAVVAGDSALARAPTTRTRAAYTFGTNAATPFCPGGVDAAPDPAASAAAAAGSHASIGAAALAALGAGGGQLAAQAPGLPRGVPELATGWPRCL